MSFGAMRKPFTCADVRACLELTYTTWTEKVYSPISDVLISNDYMIRIDEEGKIAYVAATSGSNLTEIDLDDGTLTVLVSTNWLWQNAHGEIISGNRATSALSKYIIGFDTNTTPYTLKVFKDGVLLWSYQIAQVATSVSVCISSNGKYIIIIDNTNSVYRVFEGS